MERKQIFFRIHFHFFSSSKLTFSSIYQPCIQLNGSSPYYFGKQILIFIEQIFLTKKMSFGKFVLMMVGEQQTDKVATSSTL